MAVNLKIFGSRAAGVGALLLAALVGILPVALGRAQAGTAGVASGGWPGLAPSVNDGFDKSLAALKDMPAGELVRVKKEALGRLLTIRQQFELYKIQHRDLWPRFVLVENCWSAMTTRTDGAGGLTAAGKFGPYMTGAPENPLVGLVGVARPGEAWSHVGWTYDEKTGRVTLVVPPGFDVSGMPAGDVTMFTVEQDARYKEGERKIYEARARLRGLQNSMTMYWVKRGKVFPTFVELETELVGVKEGEAGWGLAHPPVNPFTGKTALGAHGRVDGEAGWTYEEGTHLIRVVVPGGVEVGGVDEEEVEWVK